MWGLSPYHPGIVIMTCVVVGGGGGEGCLHPHFAEMYWNGEGGNWCGFQYQVNHNNYIRAKLRWGGHHDHSSSRLLYYLIREIKTWLNINHIITVISNDTSASSSTTSFRCPLSQWPSWRPRLISAPQGHRTTSLSGVPSGHGWSQCYIVF